tara:strand:+ start:65 stop:1045 length:981 start_codon:yes stop_codon:yes gene_type:complete
MTDIEIFYYDNNDIKEIIDNGFDYKLPEKTIEIIENLSKKVGAPSYIKTPSFQKKFYNKGSYHKNNYKKGKNKAVEISDTDWETIRHFKATEIKKKEGKDAYIDNIKRSLNKITDDSYPVVRDEILLVIEEVRTLENSDELLLSIGKIIFTIASQNKFYSKLYAKLYSELKEKVSVMSDIFNKSYSEFLKTFDVIEYVDADEDYDKFCLVNKDNDNRKAMSLFIVYLIHYQMLEVDSGITLMKQLTEQFQKNIEKEDSDKIAEEICENISIIMTNFDKLNIDVQESKVWDNIVDYVRDLCKKEADEFPSLTNKIIFKCMDIIEEIE